MQIEVVRSARRRKTVQAREVDGVLRVSIPAWMSPADEQRWVGEMARRRERRTSTSGVDLGARARTLADRHDLPRPTSIRWSARQAWRWGSCTPATGAIRISDRLAAEPRWVLDHVIVHELAHLVVAGHGPRFDALVARYPLAERATGFLIARSTGTGEPPTGSDAPDPGGWTSDGAPWCGDEAARSVGAP